MKSKSLTILASLIVVLIVAGYVKSTNNKVLQGTTRLKSRERLKGLVKNAKEKGETSLELHGVISNNAQFTTLADALKAFTLLKVELISKKSIVDDNELISTWYKFRTIDTLSESKVVYDFSFMMPPPEMLPLQEDELLVSVSGGTVVIDGVEVSSGEPEEPRLSAFDENQKYLLFLCVDRTTKIATANLGVSGVLAVREDNTFVPFNGKERHVYDELKTNSIPDLQNSLKSSR